MKKETEKIEIPFGAKDSELYKFEYTIPEGYEAEIKGGKVIVKKKESKDERIRKSLVDYFGKFKPGNMWNEVFSFGDVLYYLEKRKEQKPIPTEDEKDFLEKEVKAFLCNYDKEFDDDAPTYDIAEHFYQLGKNSQKPAEWSEEDEKVLKTTIAVIELNIKKGSQITTTATPSGYINREDLIKKLKSFRPQPHWKPSEEQMKAMALVNDYHVFASTKNRAAIKSLYEDLKKL